MSQFEFIFPIDIHPCITYRQMWPNTQLCLSKHVSEMQILNWHIFLKFVDSLWTFIDFSQYYSNSSRNLRVWSLSHNITQDNWTWLNLNSCVWYQDFLLLYIIEFSFRFVSYSRLNSISIIFLKLLSKG